MLSRFIVRRAFCFLCFLLLLPAAVQAATYYVDATRGSDRNNGQTIQTPWRTIAKVNGSTFKPGDSILFKSGSTWREQLNIPSSGAAGSPITFGAYGTGAKPVISGADVLPSAGWRVYSGNIYVIKLGSITPPTQLYEDGTYYDPAHYPNSGYLLATANSTDTTSIIDSNLNLQASQVVGATVKVRPVSWSITTATATAYDPVAQKITLNGPVYNSTLTMTAGWGFYLQNQLWMLTSPGGWYYDPVAGKLYLWTTGSDNPNNHIVEVSNRIYGVYAYGRSYITVNNITITNANRYNLCILNGAGVVVNNLTTSGGQNGIYLDSITSGSSIQACSVQNSLSTGIVGYRLGSNTNILNNTINNAGNIGASPGTSQAGIYATGTAINIMNNTVTNSGYTGIEGEGNLLTIQNNRVDMSCLVLDDCGGIYTGDTAGSGTVSKNISNNTVSNSIGNLSGTSNTNTIAEGIYLDGGSYNITVQNNTVSNTDFGIYIHNGHNNTVSGNTVYAARINGVRIYQDSRAAPGCTHDNMITGNTFETISTGATASYYSAAIQTATNFGSYDFNYYCHPNSNYVVTNQNVNYTLPAWQQATGQDLHSTDTISSCTNP